MNAVMEHTIAQEAGMWLFRLKDDESAECRAEFTAWLQTSPRHVAEFLLASATDVDLGRLESQPPVDIDALLKECAPNVTALPHSGVFAAGGASETATKRRLAWRRQRTWATAAGVAALVIAAGVLWQQGMFGSDTYRTDIGEQRAIKLADGSVVQLNTRSRIRVKFSNTTRMVELLQGEALFTAAPEKSRPFLVRSGATTVQAVGTQFNIYCRADGATVSVVEGRVRITSRTGSSAQPLLLDAGQQAAVESSGRIVKSPVPEIARALAWRQRHLEFRSATVAEVAAEFNRYNPLQLRIADDTIATRRMSGLFNADDPQSLLDFLANGGDVYFDRQDAVVTLRAN